LAYQKDIRIPSLPVTQWRTPAENREGELRLIHELNIHPVLARVMINRNLSDPEDAHRYLHPSLKDLHNPFLMKDIKKGLERTIAAVTRREKIVIYGDYDADGITAIVILYDFLTKAGADVTYYIPDRIREGYGLNRGAIDHFKDRGITLIITVDCGISDNDEITHASSIGIDTIVLDHHEIPDTLPDAEAVINTNRSDCSFPFKPMAGVGIAFNFIIALRGRLREMGFWNGKTYPNLKDYLDLVALGTIGDIVPLIDENRIFAKIGLDLINRGGRPGIDALRSVSGAENQPVDAATASFSLIPRINAAGRVASAYDAVRLLLARDFSEALPLARKLDGYNKDRQTMEKNILNSILLEIEETMDIERTPAIVLASPEWHPGVIGIVASKLVDLFYRPAILISIKDGIGKGSGRSIQEFNLHRGLANCRVHLLSFGGHRFAGGLSLLEENIESFRSALVNSVRQEVCLPHLVPSSIIDARCDLEDITCDLVLQLENLAPYGSMNPEPIIHAGGVKVAFPTVVGGHHLKMRMVGQKASCPSIWFGKGDIIGALRDEKWDILFTPQLNHWNGNTMIQLRLRDMARSNL